MRFLPLVITLLIIAAPTALTVISSAQAEDATEQSVADSIKIRARPLLKALSLIGTPYKFGSSNPNKGLDCSGFVKHVYKESADISLPRTAAAMSEAGEEVTQSELKPGDLVFFNTRKRPNSHVGIYAGDGTFVHASSSHTREVTISNIADKYWATRFNGARRVLPLE